MDNDPLIRLARRYTYIAGITLVVTPMMGLALQAMELKTFSRGGWREMTAFMVPISIALFASTLLDFSLTISRVAERLAPRPMEPGPHRGKRSGFRPKRLLMALLVVLLVFALGDQLAVQRIEAEMIERARQSSATFASALQNMADYRYEEAWVGQTAINLELMAMQGSYSSVTLILPDSINGQKVYLEFGARTSIDEDVAEPRVRQALQTSLDVHAYLDTVFNLGSAEPRFRARSAQYELLLPVRAGSRAVVVRFHEP